MARTFAARSGEPVPVGSVDAGGGGDGDRPVGAGGRVGGADLGPVRGVARGDQLGLAERVLRQDTLAGMKSLSRPYPRKHLPRELVRVLITTAEQRRDKAQAARCEHPQSVGAERELFRAE